MTLTRRTVLRRAGLGSLAIMLPLPLVQAQSSTLRVSSLGDGLHLITGAGANVVVAVTEQGVVVVDGGLREHAEALLQAIQELADGKPILALFNTNWRPEHTGLNHLLGGTGVDIIAHENTRLWQTTDIRVDWEDKVYPPLPVQAQANKSFYSTGSMSLGTETIDYGHLPQAHTDGDIYLFFRQANVLVASDLLAVGRFPVLDYATGGWVGGMQRASRALLELVDDATRIIPAEGGVQDRQALQLQAEMLDQAREQVALAYRNGRSLEQFKASRPSADFPGRWGDADAFLTQLYKGAWGHVRELGGII